MPDRHVFHVRYTLALRCLGYDHEWLLASAAGHCIEYGRRIVTVHLGRLPSERSEFFGERIEGRMGLGGAAETLEVIVVDAGDDVGKPERGRHQHRFPGRSFLHLAVAQHGVNDAVGLAATLRKRHADYHGETMPERAGRSFDPRIAVIGMAAEPP